MTGHQYPRWQRGHEAVLLYILEHPAAKRAAIAAATGYSMDQISRITLSPDFQRRYADALEAHRRQLSLATARRMRELASK